ncbi:MAG: hypothetical protein Q9210_003139 [Variospora velana]
MAQPGARTSLLSLPLAIRDRIYDYLLTTRPQIVPRCRTPAPQTRTFTSFTSQPTLAPSILRTCKRIAAEGRTVLYSKNVFLLSDPKRDHHWLNTIGGSNVKLLTSFRIFVEAVGDGEASWYQLLRVLARYATGLQHIYIFWDSEETCGHYGAGRNVHFARELTEIQNVQSLVLDGYYASQWPRYLTERMNVQVVEKERSQGAWQMLRKYQRGTQHVVA